jgi:hypothetical protein
MPAGDRRVRHGNDIIRGSTDGSGLYQRINGFLKSLFQSQSKSFHG